MNEPGHNSATVSAGQLRAFVERIENEERAIADRNDDKKDIYTEAKSSGFCTKTIKKIVAMRRQDRDKRREEQEILDIYLTALGMVE